MRFLRALLCLSFGLLALSAESHAEKRLAFLAGGSGEEGQDNFLVHDLSDFAKKLSARGWEVHAAAGPRDHAITASSVSGTNANVLREVKSLAAHAKPGDELLVLIHSHGRARETEWGQRSHSIVSEDKDPSGAEPGLDLDAIGAPLARAAASGAHVALIDLSCYSGTTQLLLKTPSSCTATLASPSYVSFCSGRPEERHFAARFLDLPKAGTPISLEAQFLSARRADLDSVNLPEISSRETPAAEAWDKLLNTVDPLDVYEDLKNFRPGPKPFAVATLLGAIPNGPLKPKLKAALAKLLATRVTIEKQIDPMAKSYDVASLELKLAGRDSFKISPGNLTEILDRTQKSGELDGLSDAQRNLLTSLKENPEATAPLKSELEAFRVRKERFDSDVDLLADEAGKAMNVERELYDSLSRPVSDPTRAAACGTFSL